MKRRNGERLLSHDDDNEEYAAEENDYQDLTVYLDIAKGCVQESMKRMGMPESYVSDILTTVQEDDSKKQKGNTSIQRPYYILRAMQIMPVLLGFFCLWKMYRSEDYSSIFRWTLMSLFFGFLVYLIYRFMVHERLYILCKTLWITIITSISSKKTNQSVLINFDIRIERGKKQSSNRHFSLTKTLLNEETILWKVAKDLGHGWSPYGPTQNSDAGLTFSGDLPTPGGSRIYKKINIKNDSRITMFHWVSGLFFLMSVLCMITLYNHCYGYAEPSSGVWRVFNAAESDFSEMFSIFAFSK